MTVIILSVLGIIFGLAKRVGIQPMIAGAETSEDPNHPVEIYYGNPDFKTLGAMLKNLNVQVYPEDKVQAVPLPEFGLGSRITISRSTPVNITDAKKEKKYRTWAKTVGELLSNEHLSLEYQDSVEPPADAPIFWNMSVKITRVAEVDMTQREDIDFKTIQKSDHDVERGTNKVETKGEKGQKEVTYHIKRIDGEEVSRKIIETKVIKEPVTEVLIVGTGPKLVHSGLYIDTFNAAAKKYDVNATALQCLMMCESNGHTDSVAAAGYVGLFQYDPGFWGPASDAAGFANADWQDIKAQIFTTARLISIGQSRRWPPFAKGCPRTNYTPCATK